jgi:hypothetical protein
MKVGMTNLTSYDIERKSILLIRGQNHETGRSVT